MNGINELSNSTQSSDEKEWVDLLGSGALMKKIITKGDDIIRPEQGSVCTIDYKCYQLDNKFPLEEKNGFVMTIGALDNIQGLDVAVNLMYLNEKAEIMVQPRFAYGEQGNLSDPKVAPNASLLYEVHLKDIQLVEDIESLSLSERQAKGTQKRLRGNWWFNRQNWGSAIQCYRKALDFLDEPHGAKSGTESDPSDNSLHAILDERLRVHNNMALAQIKIGADDAALHSLECVLRCQPNNVKALFRKAKILTNKNEVEEAIKVLKTAYNISSSFTDTDPIIVSELRRLVKINQEHKRSEREMAKKMLGAFGTDSTSKKKSTFWTKTNIVYLSTPIIVAFCIYHYLSK